MGGFTSKQWFQIISGVNGGLITGAALLQTLFGQDLTLKIVAVLGIIGIIINSVGTALSGADSPATQIKNVAALPGVARISIDAAATNGVAAAALDPTQPKIGPTTPDVRAQLVAKSAA
jgi:hypothetical protein